MTPEMQQFVEKSKEIKKQLATEGERVFRAMFKAFFEAHPEVLAVQWDQYTPYFNDGDACEFSVNTPEFRTESGGAFHSSYDKMFYGQETPLAKAVKSMCAAITSDEVADVALAAFGDHAQITATRESFDVEEYEHD